MSHQLPLRLNPRHGKEFSNFYTGTNGAAVSAVRRAVEARGGATRVVYVWGGPGSGRSHLLHAACHLAGALQRTAAYLPMRDYAGQPSELADGLDTMQLVCVDDIDAAAGNGAWQQALFHLHNRLAEQGAALLVSARSAPGGLALTLADLTSRLAAGLVFRLHPLGDAHMAAALRAEAERRGMRLDEEATRYILRRYPRAPGALWDLLDRLDGASLAAKRRLTVPFIRSHLNPQEE